MATTKPSFAQDLVDRTWSESIVPELVEYIRIPNQSPLFDPDWADHGHMDRAVALVAGWCRAQPIEGLSVEVVRLPGRTPVIVAEVPGSGGVAGTVLLYGHLDKQPPMSGWREDLGPWTPVLEDGRLYGRGGADDGYAAFASLTAIRAVLAEGRPLARCVVLIEACEESGSPDLPAYIEELGGRIGTPDLVVCLDSGCGNYDQLWATTSLRGMATGTLTVETLSEGVHSGDASGIVPETFRVARALLSRLEDETTGRMRLDELVVTVPAARRQEAARAADALAGRIEARYPLLAGVRPQRDDPVDMVLARTWEPTLTVTGQDGLPLLASAGNVLRPATSLRLSFRLPPTCDGPSALAAIRSVLETDPPHGARVRFHDAEACSGWNAPPTAPWLEAAMDEASRRAFGRPACSMGEGGTIPFMGMLGASFPEAQFLITGVLGPGSNAHGPNEFLEIATARRLTAAVASILADHARHRS